MTVHSSMGLSSNFAAPGFDGESAACRSRLDAAEARMRTVVAGRHTPGEARTAAAALTAALGQATAVAARARAHGDTAAQRGRGRLRRREVVRTAARGTQQWSAELQRLSEVGVWLRRTTLDDLGVQLPSTVQVANYAALGPRVAGMGFEGDAVCPPDGPAIGLDLQAIVDGYLPLAAAERAMTAVPGSSRGGITPCRR